MFQMGNKFSVQSANLLLTLQAGTTAPADPGLHETWIDISTSPPQLKRYNGTGWETVADHFYTPADGEEGIINYPFGFSVNPITTNASGWPIYAGFAFTIRCQGARNIQFFVDQWGNISHYRGARTDAAGQCSPTGYTPWYKMYTDYNIGTKIQSGTVTITAAGVWQTVTFNSAFESDPDISFAVEGSGGTVTYKNLSSTGFEVRQTDIKTTVKFIAMI